MKAGRGVVWAALAGALGATFAAYLRPDAVLSLATRVWSCF